MNIIFGPIAPKKFLLKPAQIKQDTEVSIILDNLCDALMNTTLERGDKTEAEYAAMVMDEYFATAHGTPDMYSLQDISYKLNQSFASAYSVLVDTIAPEVTALSARIDELSQQLMDRRLGHQDASGNYTNAAPRFKLLDVSQLYTAYNATATNCAVHLCKKYNFHVEYVNDTNINALLNNIEATADIDVPKDTINKIFGDAVVVVTVNGDDDVVIDTSEPENVKADDNVQVNDINSKTPTDGDGDNSDGGSANVTVTTNDDASVTVNVNGDTVSTDPEETELLKLMVNSCFSTAAFERLREALFAARGYVNGKCLTSSLFFLSSQLHKLMAKIGPKHLSEATMRMVSENLSRIHELQMGALIFLDVQSAGFADKVILAKNLLNKNMVNKAMSEGVDIYSFVRDYIRVYHNDNVDDLYHTKMQNLLIGQGVSYDQLLVSRYKVEEKLIAAKDETKKDFSNLLQSTRLEAFHTVVGNYIRETANAGTAEQLNVKENDNTSFIIRNDIRLQQLEDVLRSSGENTNIEDLLYNFYFSNWYGGTTVEKLYHYTSEYLRQSMSTSTINADAIYLAKTQAMVDLGSQSLFDAFIKA